MGRDVYILDEKTAPIALELPPPTTAKCAAVPAREDTRIIGYNIILSGGSQVFERERELGWPGAGSRVSVCHMVPKKRSAEDMAS